MLDIDRELARSAEISDFLLLNRGIITHSYGIFLIMDPASHLPLQTPTSHLPEYFDPTSHLPTYFHPNLPPPQIRVMGPKSLYVLSLLGTIIKSL